MNGVPEASARPMLALFVLLTVPLLAGAALAPHVFNGLQALGEVTGAFSTLTESRFERVASRCVMIIAALILFPVMRMTGLMLEVRTALAGSRDRRREWGVSFAVGVFSMAMIYMAGWIGGVYQLDPGIGGGATIALRLAGFLVGALFIGVFEEIFFRGFFFGVLRIRLGLWLGLIFSSVFFSVIHFCRPRFPEMLEQASWHSGFALIPHMFDRFVWERDAVFAGTLFVMGLTLSLFYQKRGNLYLVMGLHGGWVWAMLSGAWLFKRVPEVMPVWFGRGSLASKGLLSLVVISLFLVAALWISRTRRSAT